MKILLFSMLAFMVFLGTMTFAGAQTPNFSIGFDSSFGTRGTNSSQFHNPQGIAVDDSGNLYVVDQVNNRVEKFNSVDNYLSTIGSSGSANGQLLSPTSVAIDSFGNVYVTDIGNYRVEKFDPAGNFVLQFGTRGSDDGQFSSIQGIAVDTSGNAYVADLLHPIQKFDSSGKFISEIGAGKINGATGIALDNSGNLYVLDNGGSQVVEFSSSGNFIKEWGTFCNLFRTTGCIDPDGSGPFALGDGQFNDPNGIAIDNSGNIFVTDTQNNRVEVFDSSGHFIYKFGANGNDNGQFMTPIGIAVANSGSLYVVDQNNDRVETFRITYGSTTSAPNEVSTIPKIYQLTPSPTMPDLSNNTVSQSQNVSSTEQANTTQTIQPNYTQTIQPNTTQTVQTNATVPTLSSMPSKIPTWVKGIFSYYGQGQMSDDELINAIQFLIQQGIIKLK